MKQKFVLVFAVFCFILINCATNKSISAEPQKEIIYPEFYKTRISTFSEYIAMRPKLEDYVDPKLPALGPQNYKANLKWAEDLTKYRTTSQGWAISVDIDKFTDGKKGFITKFFKNDVPVRVNYEGNQYFISIGFHTFPGAVGRVRIDKNEVITFTTESFIDPVLFQQMLTGEKGIAQYMKWPNKEPVDLSFDLYGFKEAFDIFEWLVSLK